MRSATPSRRLQALRALTLTVSALLTVGCGADEAADRKAGPDDTAADAAVGTPVDPTELCSTWSASHASDANGTGLPPEFMEALEQTVPASLQADVAVVLEYDRLDREARIEGAEDPEASAGPDQAVPDLVGEDLAAVSRVMAWVQTTCVDTSLVAPPLDAVPAGLQVCAAAVTPTDLLDDFVTGQTVVYAPADAEDPYAGQVLALMWGSGSHKGDGDGTPVMLRQAQGVTDAVLAPITVFQQTVLPELGTVVAWTEGEQSFGLYGRGWDSTQSAELLAVAESIQRTSADDGEPTYEIASDALPAGFAQIHTGPSGGVSTLGTGAYTVFFRAGTEADDALGTRPVVQLSGTPSSPGGDELWRLLALESERIQVGGTTVSITDRAWSGRGPVIASWRTREGHVTVTGIDSEGEPSIDRELILQMVEASRELTDEEWIELSAGNELC